MDAVQLLRDAVIKPFMMLVRSGAIPNGSANEMLEELIEDFPENLQPSTRYALASELFSLSASARISLRDGPVRGG
nr:hypothetical protein [Sphingomonas bacterium]